jgi:DNA-binding GntR family transcriptional regulator
VIYMAGRTLTPKEIAAEFGTSPKRLRKFLRSETAVEDRPGKGGRWAIPASTVKSMRKRFDAWSAEEARKRAEALAAKEDETETDEVEDETDEDGE